MVAKLPLALSSDSANTQLNLQVVGDAEEHFTYEIVNKTFKLLVGGKE